MRGALMPCEEPTFMVAVISSSTESLPLPSTSNSLNAASGSRFFENIGKISPAVGRPKPIDGGRICQGLCVHLRCRVSSGVAVLQCKPATLQVREGR